MVLIRGLDWVVANKDTYNIRVLNLSFGAPPQSHYWDDPLNQAVMAAWRAGIPVPEPLLLEEDAAVLERPFSLMAEVTGCESAIAISPALALITVMFIVPSRRPR